MSKSVAHRKPHGDLTAGMVLGRPFVRQLPLPSSREAQRVKRVSAVLSLWLVSMWGGHGQSRRAWCARHCAIAPRRDGEAHSDLRAFNVDGRLGLRV